MRHLILTILLITSATALDQSGAEAAIARGWSALDAGGSDHTKNVEAALAFTEALGYYAEAGDAETCRQLQANIYWARKKFDMNDIQTYLAAKGNEAPAVDEMKRVADADVAASEADAYFARAEAFAKAHAADHLRVAIRYFEVASRFPGTQAAMDAQQRSLDEQVQAKAPAAGKVAKVEKPKPTPTEKQQVQKIADATVKAAQAGLIPVSWIESAKYGAPNADSSVKAELLALVGRADEVRVNNALFNMDPAPNQHKALTIEYKTPSGKKLTKVVRETETFTPAKLLFDDRAGAIKTDEITAPIHRR